MRRRYLPGSLVIETQFATAGGMVMVTDAWAPYLLLGKLQTVVWVLRKA